MPRSRTPLSARHRRQAATRRPRASHTTAPKSSNPHNGALVTRGFMLGRLPYAGLVPRRATGDGRHPKTFTIYGAPNSFTRALGAEIPHGRFCRPGRMDTEPSPPSRAVFDSGLALSVPFRLYQYEWPVLWHAASPALILLYFPATFSGCMQVCTVYAPIFQPMSLCQRYSDSALKLAV
jgi:hypothetical protein